LRDAVDALRLARGESIRSERVWPEFGELEQAARDQEAKAWDEIERTVHQKLDDPLD
jgi:hypothetical protein